MGLHGGIRMLSRGEVQRLLVTRECIETIETAFRQYSDSNTIKTGVLGAHVAGGGFHIKTAGQHRPGSPPTFAAKVNANFPGNPTRNGLPTIQGLISLFDSSDGRPLAIMDSIEITSVRTGAATAVAARYLAREDSSTITICGCG